MTASGSLRSWAPSPEPACPLLSHPQHCIQDGRPLLPPRTVALHMHTHTHTCTHICTCARTHTRRCGSASRPPPLLMHTHVHMYTCTHTHTGVTSRPPLSSDPQSHVLLGTWCPPPLLSLATGPTYQPSPSAQDLTYTEAAPGLGQASLGPHWGLPWAS